VVFSPCRDFGLARPCLVAHSPPDHSPNGGEKAHLPVARKQAGNRIDLVFPRFSSHFPGEIG
jgi:hypothetical protein